MAEAQGTQTPGRPWHLWVVGMLGGLWSTIGVLSFMLTQTNVVDVSAPRRSRRLPGNPCQ